jgi:hypothetical protein
MAILHLNIMTSEKVKEIIVSLQPVSVKGQ